MTRRIRIAGGVLACALVVGSPALAAGRGFKRLAVMDFENASRDKALDWIGVGIAETLSTELGRIQDLTLVERNRLNDALKELKFGRSEAVDQATAQKMGRMLGADSVVVGSFQKFQNNLRIVARVVDVETGTIRVPARVDGVYNDMFALQIDLAKKLVEEMKGSLAEADKKRLEAAPSKNVDALRAYSDGVYFYRNDLAQDAVAEFDRALALDPNYAEAHFYKGMALAKLKRWDDAITSFKRTLPRALAEHRVTWSWDAPFETDGSQRTVFPGFDPTAFSPQDMFSRLGLLRAQRRLVYAERGTNSTIVHLLDLEQRVARRLELPTDALLNIGVATDRMTIIPSATLASLFSGNIAFYGIDANDGTAVWHHEIKDLGGFPMSAVADRVLWEYLPPLHRLVAYDEASLQPKWQRNDLDLEFGYPHVRSTRSHGTVLIAKSPVERKIHAIRVSDGQDAWTADVQSDKTYQMKTDQALMVFEPDRRVFALDFETGKPLFDIPVQQVPQVHGVGLANFVTVTALAHEHTLYLPSAADELLAVDLERGTAADRRVRWRTPLQRKVHSLGVYGARVYASTQSGDLLILDAGSGTLQASRKIAGKELGIDYAGDDIVVASSDEAVFGLDPKTGVKQWDYPSNARAQKPLYFKGVVILQTSPTQISALDAQTGALLWQYAGKLATASLVSQLFGVNMPSVYLTDDSFFIVEQEGVKEYTIDKGAAQGITNKEALTELAGALLAKGEREEAPRFAATARSADPNYPPLRLLQARLDQARGDVAAARRELVTYVDLAGRQSRSGQDIIGELKRDHGLLWQTETGKPLTGFPALVDGKLLSVGRARGSDAQFALLEAATGKVLWRQTARARARSRLREQIATRVRRARPEQRSQERSARRRRSRQRQPQRAGAIDDALRRDPGAHRVCRRPDLRRDVFRRCVRAKGRRSHYGLQCGVGRPSLGSPARLCRELRGRADPYRTLLSQEGLPAVLDRPGRPRGARRGRRRVR